MACVSTNINRSIVDICLLCDLFAPSSFSPALLEIWLYIAATGLASINVAFTFWLAYRLRLATAVFKCLGRLSNAYA